MLLADKGKGCEAALYTRLLDQLAHRQAPKARNGWVPTYPKASSFFRGKGQFALGAARPLRAGGLDRLPAVRGLTEEIQHHSS